MNKITAIINVVKNITKYAGLVFLVIETAQFFTDGLEKLQNAKQDESK